MKRLFAFLLCVIVICTLALVASAAGSSVSITPSETTLHRGDTFTIVANLTNSDAINLGTVVLSYDESVFELTGGTCHVAGANPAQVVVAQKAGTFFLGSATVVSGKIFTFNFKVKDDAAFGTYTFTTTAAIGTTGGNKIDATGTTITVACKHNYSNWKDAGNGKHSKTCSICQDVQTVSHTWNGGTVTKQPTCKETGVRTYTCTGCNATKTETIAKTTDHKYGSWTKVNDTTHKHTCSVCSKEETASHTWNSGTVTKTATCKEDGVKTYTCTGCNATKTETIAKTNDHKYGSWVKVNDTTHKHTCSVCSKEKTTNHTWNSGTVTKAATCKEEGVKTYTCTGCNATKTEVIAKLTTHTYDHACDTDCNVCGVTRTTTHNYTATWSKDGTNHWHECSVCKEKKDITAHTPGAEPTETTAQTCTECGYVIKAALGHTHNYAEEWTSDENGHWHICSGCEDKGSYAAHIPGPDATATTDQVCTECGYVLKEATGETEPTTAPTQAPTQQPTTAPTNPTAQPNTEKDDFSLVVIIIAAVVLAGGATAGVIIWKKKH